MTRTVSRNAVAVLGLLALLSGTRLSGAETAEPVDLTIHDGVLDWIHVLSEPPSSTSVIVVQEFDATEADLRTGSEGGGKKHVAAAAMMQSEAPRAVAAEVVRWLKELGPFPEAIVDAGDPLPENAVVIAGRFTILNPGSRAKRYWAGFGAGKGVMEIEGRIENAVGEVLAEFRQKRLTVMGAFGGSYERKMRADAARFGEDVASFLRAWVLEENLKD